MSQDRTVHHWIADISVTLVPVNKYGDTLPGNRLSYSVAMSGHKSLPEIVEKLATLEEG